MTPGDSQEPTHVAIESSTARWNDLNRLLQRGVFCPLAAPCSVQVYLVDRLGIDPGYVRDKIATLFLDGSVIDDLEKTTLEPGSTLTLSAAMPGLVGATLRKGGFYKAMRSDIDWKEGSHQPHSDGPQNYIRVKLYNSVMKDLGPSLMRRGFLIERE